MTDFFRTKAFFVAAAMFLERAGWSSLSGIGTNNDVLNRHILYPEYPASPITNGTTPFEFESMFFPSEQICDIGICPEDAYSNVTYTNNRNNDFPIFGPFSCSDMVSVQTPVLDQDNEPDGTFQGIASLLSLGLLVKFKMWLEQEEQLAEEARAEEQWVAEEQWMHETQQAVAAKVGAIEHSEAVENLFCTLQQERELEREAAQLAEEHFIAEQQAIEQRLADYRDAEKLMWAEYHSAQKDFEEVYNRIINKQYERLATELAVQLEREDELEQQRAAEEAQRAAAELEAFEQLRAAEEAQRVAAELEAFEQLRAAEEAQRVAAELALLEQQRIIKFRQDTIRYNGIEHRMSRGVTLSVPEMVWFFNYQREAEKKAIAEATADIAVSAEQNIRTILG